ncbi:MAG: DbpA RNA binding domain-containing protein, partial [Opitutaceae bacterium]
AWLSASCIGALNSPRQPRGGKPPTGARPIKPRAKTAFERPARTGREAGMATVRLNAGSRHGVTAADIVGKIAGVTRLPASIVGAIDLHEDHALVDVESHHAELIVKKLARVRVKGVSLEPRTEPPAA